jgi:hypothetical protein
MKGAHKRLDFAHACAHHGFWQRGVRSQWSPSSKCSPPRASYKCTRRLRMYPMLFWMRLLGNHHAVVRYCPCAAMHERHAIPAQRSKILARVDMSEHEIYHHTEYRNHTLRWQATVDGQYSAPPAPDTSKQPTFRRLEQ